MTTFDDRKNAAEGKYALDEQQHFKAVNRRNKLAGLWAAEKMGLSGDEAATYAKSVVEADFEEKGDADVIRKLKGDLAAKGHSVSDAEIENLLAEKMAVASHQIASE